MMSGEFVFGLDGELHRRQLRRLVGGEAHAGDVTDDRLDERGDRGERERHDEPEPVSVVAAAAQHPDGVHGGGQEPGDDVRRDEHVEELRPQRTVEDRRQRVDVGRPQRARCVDDRARNRSARSSTR